MLTCLGNELCVMVVVAVEPGGVAGVGGPGTLLLTVAVAGRPLLPGLTPGVLPPPPVPGLFFAPFPLGGTGSNSISSFGNVEICKKKKKKN